MSGYRDDCAVAAVGDCGEPHRADEQRAQELRRLTGLSALQEQPNRRSNQRQEKKDAEAPERRNAPSPAEPVDRARDERDEGYGDEELTEREGACRVRRPRACGRDCDGPVWCG
jgi:hypothetical protein